MAVVRSRVSAVVIAIILVWLVIGVIAAVQRGYFGGSDTNCAKVGTTMVTIISGPLNYVGVNPTIDCSLPQPSQYYFRSRQQDPPIYKMPEFGVDASGGP